MKLPEQNYQASLSQLDTRFKFNKFRTDDNTKLQIGVFVIVVSEKISHLPVGYMPTTFSECME